MWSPQRQASANSTSRGTRRVASAVKIEKGASICEGGPIVAVGPSSADASGCSSLVREAAALCIRAAELAEADEAAAEAAVCARTIAHESACAALQAEFESLSTASEERISGLQAELRSERGDRSRIAGELRAAKQAAAEGSSDSALENMRLNARLRDMNAVIEKQKQRIADHEERIRALGACVTNRGLGRGRPRKRKRLSEASIGEALAEIVCADAAGEACSRVGDLTGIITREEDSIPVTQPGIPSRGSPQLARKQARRHNETGAAPRSSSCSVSAASVPDVVDVDDDASCRRSAHLAIAEVSPTPQAADVDRGAGLDAGLRSDCDGQLGRADDGPCTASLARLSDVPGLRVYVMPQSSTKYAREIDRDHAENALTTPLRVSDAGQLVQSAVDGSVSVGVRLETSILAFGSSAKEMMPPPLPPARRAPSSITQGSSGLRRAATVGEAPGRAVRAEGRTAATAAIAAAAPSGHFDSKGVPCRCVVRGKEARLGLRAFDCEQCRNFYDATGSTTREIKLSRHRFAHAPASTPPGFWELSFPQPHDDGE